MAKKEIGYGDKVTGGIPKDVHEQQWWFDDANEVKDTINHNSTELYDRTDGNIPHQVIPAKVIWANLSATVQEQDLIWTAVNADLTTIVKHNHDLIFRTVRKVYGQVGSIKTYDVYETYWRLRDKLTVIGGSNVSLGSGNTQLNSTNGIMTFAGRKITKVVDGVIQEGGFTVDFGATGATPIEDSVNSGASYETGKGLFLFKGNDGTDDYLYIYNGVEEKIGSGSGVTTSATDFSILSEGTSDSPPTDGQTIKLQGDTGEGEFPLAIDFVGADVTRDPVTDHAIVTIEASSSSSSVPSDEDFNSLDITPINDYINLPTVNSLSNQGTHPSVIDFENNLFGGYRYWIAYTPYPNGNDSFENPYIMVSNDRLNWIEHPSITNPIEPDPGGNNHNSDTEIIYDEENNRLVCYWRFVDKSPNPDTATIFARTIASDGTLGVKTTVLFSADGETVANLISPCIIKENTGWAMYHGTETIVKRTSNDLLDFSSSTPIICTSTGIPAGSQVWHLGMTKVNGTLYCALNNKFSNNTVNDLLIGYATNADATDFKFFPLLERTANTFYDRSLYRATIQPIEVGYKHITFGMWYGGVDLAGPWRIGYIEFSIGTKLKRQKNYIPSSEIDVSNPFINTYGTLRNVSTQTTYNISKVEKGSSTLIKHNSATEPTFTWTNGASTPIKIAGSNFVANTDIYIWVQYMSSNVEYFFATIL